MPVPASHDKNEHRPTSYRLQTIRRFTPWLVRIGTPAFRRWFVSVFPNKNVRKVQQITDTIWSKATQIYELKKAQLESGEEGVLKKVEDAKDIISILRKPHLEGQRQSSEY